MRQMATIRLLAVAVAAIAGTVVFMVACGGGPSAAHAGLTCSQWQVTQINISDSCGGTVPKDGTACDLPAGWQPITSSNNAYDSIILGRCKP